MLTKRPRIYHSGKTFKERLFHHELAAKHGELIFGFSNHVFSNINRDFIALLKDTRESLDLDRRFQRLEKLRELDEAVDYLSEQKYREALERQHRGPQPKPTQSRAPAEPAHLRIVQPDPKPLEVERYRIARPDPKPPVVEHYRIVREEPAPEPPTRYRIIDQDPD